MEPSTELLVASDDQFQRGLIWCWTVGMMTLRAIQRQVPAAASRRWRLLAATVNRAAHQREFLGFSNSSPLAESSTGLRPLREQLVCLRVRRSFLQVRFFSGVGSLQLVVRAKFVQRQSRAETNDPNRALRRSWRYAMRCLFGLRSCSPTMHRARSTALLTAPHSRWRPIAAQWDCIKFVGAWGVGQVHRPQVAAIAGYARRRLLWQHFQISKLFEVMVKGRRLLDMK